VLETIIVWTEMWKRFFLLNFYLLQQTIKKSNKERANDNLKIYNTNTNVLQTKIHTSRTSSKKTSSALHWSHDKGEQIDLRSSEH